MQVNAFVSEVQQDGVPTQMLVLPYGPEAAIPAHLRAIEWRYFATTEADNIIGLRAGEVEVAMAERGYAIVKPQAPDRR